MPLGCGFEFHAVHPFPLSGNDLRVENATTVAKNRSKRYKRGHHPGVCVECQSAFDGYRKEQKYCSQKCVRASFGQRQTGKNNPSWKGGISQNHYHYKLLQVQRYPERVKARSIVAGAIRAGKLVRGPCETCGVPNGHAHHGDYGKPLEVRWFCRKHHRELHRQARESRNVSVANFGIREGNS